MERMPDQQQLEAMEKDRKKRNEEAENKHKREMLEKELAVITKMVDQLDNTIATTLADKKPTTNIENILEALNAEKKKLEIRKVSVKESLDALAHQIAERVDTRVVIQKET